MNGTSKDVDEKRIEYCDPASSEPSSAIHGLQIAKDELAVETSDGILLTIGTNSADNTSNLKLAPDGRVSWRRFHSDHFFSTNIRRRLCSFRSQATIPRTLSTGPRGKSTPF